MVLISPIATSETQLERLAICDVCPRQSSNRQKCLECRCYLTYKVMLNMSKCPLGKWENIDDNKQNEFQRSDQTEDEHS